MIHSFFFQKASFPGSFNPFPNKPLLLHFCCASLLKTPWEKEKLLMTSNFSFSHSVFYPIRELSVIFTKSKIVVCNLSLEKSKFCRLGKSKVGIVSDVANRMKASASLLNDIKILKIQTLQKVF